MFLAGVIAICSAVMTVTEAGIYVGLVDLVNMAVELTTGISSKRDISDDDTDGLAGLFAAMAQELLQHSTKTIHIFFIFPLGF
jgi:hypothetical protein